jgi:hypothetical protein
VLKPAHFLDDVQLKVAAGIALRRHDTNRQDANEQKR